MRGTILSYVDHVKADWPYASYANGYHCVVQITIEVKWWYLRSFIPT